MPHGCDLECYLTSWISALAQENREQTREATAAPYAIGKWLEAQGTTALPVPEKEEDDLEEEEEER